MYNSNLVTGFFQKIMLIDMMHSAQSIIGGLAYEDNHFNYESLNTVVSFEFESGRNVN